MKLRLFGCAAAYVLAGTLCVSAQEAPEPKMKEGASEATPSPEGKGSTQKKASPSQGRSESAQGAPERSDQRKNERAERKGGGDGARKNQAKDDTSATTKGKSDASADKSDKEPSKSTSKAAKGEEQDQGGKSAREGETDTGRAAESKQDGRTPDGAGTKRDQATDRTGDAGKNVQLSAEKRDRVQSSLRSDLKLKRETKVDIDISIGSRAPRHWAFAPVPTAVIEIVPEYRGYVVAYVEDEYVICDPNTYEVVAVLPASGDSVATTGRSTGEAGSDGQCSASLTLTESERAAILSGVEMSNEIDASGVTIGWSVPSDVDLKTLPRSVIDRSGKLSGCRYFVVDDQVAIVDPDQDKVVLLIESESK